MHNAFSDTEKILNESLIRNMYVRINGEQIHIVGVLREDGCIGYEEEKRGGCGRAFTGTAEITAGGSRIFVWFRPMAKIEWDSEAAEAAEAEAESMTDDEEHEIPLGGDQMMSVGRRIVIPEMHLSVRVGAMLSRDSRSGEWLDDWSLTAVYDDDEDGPENWLYYDGDSVSMTLQNYLTAIGAMNPRGRKHPANG